MMRHAWPLITVGAIVGLAACQGGGPSQVSGSSAPASPLPSTSAASQSPSPSSAAPSTRAAQLVAVHGAIFADGGSQVPDAQIEVQCTQYPQLSGTFAAQGGAYYIGNVPVGAVLRLRAFAPAYGAREQVFTAAYDAPDTFDDPNRVDFGGPGAPLYALSKYPDILEVTPSNGAKDLSPRSLSVQFTFSMPITSDEQHQFGSLMRVRIPTADPSPGATGYTDLDVGTSFQDQTASMTWNASGTVATFNFTAPLAVSRGLTSASIVFDQTAPASEWPTGIDGLQLGYKAIANSYDGGGAVVHNQVAPFQRDLAAIAIPSPSPNASMDDIWGLAHMTTSAFAFKADSTPANVKTVTAYPANGSVPARFVVTFDQPMCGYPLANLDPAVYSEANYRFTVGKTDGTSDTEAFNTSDPRLGGQSATAQPYFADGTLNTIVVPVSNTAFGDNTAFKFYVDPAVKDALGGSVAPSVVEGTLP